MCDMGKNAEEKISSCKPIDKTCTLGYFIKVIERSTIPELKWEMMEAITPPSLVTATGASANSG